MRFRLFWRLPLHYRKCGGKSFGQFIVCPESSEFAQHTGVCHLCQTCVPQCARQLEWLGGTHLFVWWRQQWSFCYNQADDQTFNDVLRWWIHVFINFTIKVVINPPAAKPESKNYAALVMMINASWWSLISRIGWGWWWWWCWWWWWWWSWPIPDNCSTPETNPILFFKTRF